jgi:hypothetical protein
MGNFLGGYRRGPVFPVGLTVGRLIDVLTEIVKHSEAPLILCLKEKAWKTIHYSSLELHFSIM